MGEDTGKEFGSEEASQAQSSYPGPCGGFPLKTAAGGIPGQDLPWERREG